MFATPTVHKDLHVTHGDDNECWVEFYKRPVHMEVESEQQGRPIYKDFDYLTIVFPGDKTKKVDRPVRDEDKMRFSKQWEAFAAGEEPPMEGTPLDEWPAITRSQALELKAMNVRTVEQLAKMGDHALTFFGAREYRDQARKYIEKASGIDARVTELEAQNKAQAAQVADLMAANMALMAKLTAQPQAEAEPKVRKPRGPNKPKAQTEAV